MMTCTSETVPVLTQYNSCLNLNRFSAKPLLGHHALVWVVGFRMAGVVLSGSGIRVFVLGNVEKGWGGWGKVQVNDGDGVDGRDVVGYVVYWRCLKGAVIRLMSCNALLKASRLLWVNTLSGSLFHWAIVRGKKLYL